MYAGFQAVDKAEQVPLTAYAQGAETINTMIMRLIPHGLAKYGMLHSVAYLLYGLLAFSAFSELLGRDYFTVWNWIICYLVLTGIHMIASASLIPRVWYDSMPYQINSEYSQPGTTRGHHVPFYWHVGTGLVTRVLVLVALNVFRFQHQDAMAAFNDSRYSKDKPALADVWMYLQWTSIMILVLVFFFHDLIHFSQVHDRMLNPMLRAQQA